MISIGCSSGSGYASGCANNFRCHGDDGCANCYAIPDNYQNGNGSNGGYDIRRYPCGDDSDSGCDDSIPHSHTRPL
jgi:hypothetical protein